MMTFILLEYFLFSWVMSRLTDIMICKECKYCTFPPLICISFTD